MLNYTEVKEVFADKLAHDLRGTGRFESAFYHAIKFAYEQGLNDGLEREPVVGIIDDKDA